MKNQPPIVVPIVVTTFVGLHRRLDPYLDRRRTTMIGKMIGTTLGGTTTIGTKDQDKNGWFYRGICGCMVMGSCGESTKQLTKRKRLDLCYFFICRIADTCYTAA